MRHGSLFSGIGGFDLASEWMGWENVFHCEINPFCQKVLKYYWPGSISYDDITKTDFIIHRGQIDILTGGFPCQPYSTAGKRLGTADDRHLWPEMLRAIREIQPTWIVGENVRGLVNWNGGMVFNQVQTDLEDQGYEVIPFLLPACGVNAPHKRERIWFVAHSNKKRPIDRCDNRQERYIQTDIRIAEENKSERDRWIIGLGEAGTISTNSISKRQSGSGRPIRSISSTENENWKASWSYDDDRWPTESPLLGRNDGLPPQLDGIAFSNWREESIGGFGNAVVPQLVYQIFKSL